MREKTKWFPSGVNPHRPGVYETNWRGCQGMYQYWNGEYWGMGSCLLIGAERGKAIKAMEQRCFWRGLTQNPEASHE